MIEQDEYIWFEPLRSVSCKDDDDSSAPWPIRSRPDIPRPPPPPQQHQADLTRAIYTHTVYVKKKNTGNWFHGVAPRWPAQRRWILFHSRSTEGGRSRQPDMTEWAHAHTHTEHGWRFKCTGQDLAPATTKTSTKNQRKREKEELSIYIFFLFSLSHEVAITVFDTELGKGGGENGNSLKNLMQWLHFKAIK